MFGAFWTNGQICSATSRLLLHVWFSESHSSLFMVLDIWYISHSMIFYSSKKLWYANTCPFLFGLAYQHPVVHRWFSNMVFYCNRRELLMSFWGKLAPGHQVLRLVILWRMVVDWALLSVQARYDDLQEKCFLLCFSSKTCEDIIGWPLQPCSFVDNGSDALCGWTVQEGAGIYKSGTRGRGYTSLWWQTPWCELYLSAHILTRKFSACLNFGYFLWEGRMLSLVVCVVCNSYCLGWWCVCCICWQHLKTGFFISPTVLANVKPSMQIWTDEVFGPVLAVSTFKTEAEAIEMANNSQ